MKMIRAFFIVAVILILLFFLSIAISLGVYAGMKTFFEHCFKIKIEKGVNENDVESKKN